MKTSTFLFTILLVAFSSVAFAQAGNLDNTFGNGGIVTTAVGSGNDWANSMAIQADGKIVVAGFTYNNTDNDFALVRYNTDGTLDNSFGTGGKVITGIGSGPDYAFSVAIQTDGKIVAAGYTGNYPDLDYALVRYNYDGTVDNSFGVDGKVTIDFNWSEDVAFSMALQPDGKIVAAGYSFDFVTKEDFALIRCNADGSLDNSFGEDGKVITDFNSNIDKLQSVAVQSDGKIVAAGYASFGYEVNFALVRYNSDGTLDNSFGTSGKLTSDLGSLDSRILSVVIQPDGKIVAAGVSLNGFGLGLVRCKTDGTLDSTFGANGIVTTPNVNASSVALQPDGKIVVAGVSINGYVADDFALIRYNTDGTLDNTFGEEGIVITTIDSYEDWASSVAIEPDGKIVVAGNTFNGTDEDFALARYLSGLNIGIADFSSPQSSMLIYPNPIQETEILKYTLTKDEVLDLRLYDVNGKLLKNFFTNESRTSGEHHEELNFGNLVAGNYLLTMSNGAQQVSVKIVKQ